MHRSKQQRRWWPAILALVTITLLTGCVLLVLRLRREYGETLAARTWPLGREPVIRSAGVPPAQTKPVLLLGDSRVADWGVPPATPRWHFLNAGVEGMTTAQLAVHARTVISLTKPAAVVVQIGINDLKLLGVRPELRETVVATCVSNLEVVVQESRRQGARVVLTPAWPAGNMPLVRRLVWSETVDVSVMELGSRLERRFALQPDVQVTNLFLPLTQSLSPPERAALYRDTLHLRPTAYARLTEILAGALDQFPRELAPPAP